MHMNSFMKLINYRLAGSFDPDSKIYSDGKYWGLLIANESGEEIGEIIMRPGDGCIWDVSMKMDGQFYRWIHPLKKQTFFQNMQNAGIDPYYANDEQTYIYMDDELEFVNQVGKTIESQDETTCIQIEEDVFVSVAKFAHKHDITFNDAVSVILTRQIQLEQQSEED